jgi:hypothetical protein
MLKEELSDPIDYGAHTCSAPQIAVHDDPILGCDLRQWRGQAFEEWIGVGSKTR